MFISHKGVTAIELLIVIAIIGILASVALPSFDNTFQNRRLVGAADTTAAVLNQARMDAIRTNRPVTVTFTVGANEWTVTSTAPIASTINSNNYRGVTVTLQPALFGTTTTILYEPVRGRPVIDGTPVNINQPQALTLTNARNNTVSVGITPGGTVTTCTTTGFGGYVACP